VNRALPCFTTYKYLFNSAENVKVNIRVNVSLRIFVMCILLVSPLADAEDMSGVAHKSKKFGAWTLMTMYFPKGIMYRLYQHPRNDDSATLTLDVGLHHDCGGISAVLNWPETDSWKEVFSDLHSAPPLPFRYTIHGRTDVLFARLEDSDGFVFADFGSSFPLAALRGSVDGVLVLAIDPPHDNPEAGGPNLYFDVKGFKPAFAAAIRECSSNKGMR
jgi:hypothetical protein